MAKWLFIGGIFFCWFIAPMLFDAMVAKDYGTLSGGMSELRDYRSNMGGGAPPPEDIGWADDASF